MNTTSRMNILKYNNERICRICLTESGEMNAIFGTAENISNILMFFASIQVTENDGLPAQICTTCIYEANNAYYFKQKCEASDKLLRSNLADKYAAGGVNITIGRVDVKQEVACVGQLETEDFNELFERECESDMFKTENESHAQSNHDIDDDTTNTFVESNDNASGSFQNKESHVLNDIDDDFTTSRDEMKFSEDDNPNVEDGIITTDVGSKKHRGRPKKSQISILENRKVKLQCNECDENFDRKIDLKRHLAVDHIQMDGERKFECIECSKMYPSDAILTIHMKTHNSKVYSCEQCSKKFPRLDILVEHKKRHSNDRSYLCTKCGKGFYNQMYLDRHMQTHSRDHIERQIHECTICGKQMSHSNHLLVHMRAHQDRTGPLTAETIGIAGDLLSPSSTTTTKKVILCSVCGKSCSSRSNLSVHMRRHTGKMTNFCTVCGKGYPRTTDLTIHMRQHTGEKPFVCQVCDRRFARSDKLAIHMRVHTGEKPYVCSICGRAFAQSNDLASHKRRNACSTSAPHNSQHQAIPEQHQVINIIYTNSMPESTTLSADARNQQIQTCVNHLITAPQAHDNRLALAMQTQNNPVTTVPNSLRHNNARNVQVTNFYQISQRD